MKDKGWEHPFFKEHLFSVVGTVYKCFVPCVLCKPEKTHMAVEIKAGRLLVLFKADVGST